MNKKSNVAFLCSLVLVSVFSFCNATENGTLVCTIGDLSDQYSTTTFIYKGDVVQKEVDETKADYSQMGFQTEEDFLNAFKKREKMYSGIDGVTYTISNKKSFYTEKIIIDFTVADYNKLRYNPVFGFDPDSKHLSLKNAKKDFVDMGYKCIYK